MVQTIETAPSLLFNSSLETGVRALIVLNAAYPRTFDLTEITWFDHLVVHTGDIGGPPSLHPNVPQRSGELLVRRRLVEGGLQIMRRQHLIEFLPDEDAGLVYRASDEAEGLVELTRSSYAVSLRHRADWLAAEVCSRSRLDLEEIVAERIGRWRIEFQGGDTRSTRYV